MKDEATKYSLGQPFLMDRTEIDVNGRSRKCKFASFSIDGHDYTFRISMSDFNAGKTQELLQHEIEKQLRVMELKK